MTIQGSDQPAVIGSGAQTDDELSRGKLLFSILTVLLLGIVTWWVALHLRRVPVEDGQRIIRWVSPYGSPPWQWIDWVLTSLAGVILYMLTNIASWYHRSNPRFIRYTPWYISTILKGPLVAFVILLFLTSVDVDIAGLNLDFTNVGANVLLVAAFVLGFYSRVAREQLNLIVKTLFGKAYSLAEETFSIIPNSTQVVYGQTQQFKTEPLTDVTWVASAGSIVNGLYTAPDGTNATPGQEVQITAVPVDQNVPRAVAKAILRPFEIKGKSNIAYQSKEKYQATTQDAVNWTVTPVLDGAEIKPDGEFQAPPLVKSGEIKKVTITASKRKDPAQLASIEVYIKEMSTEN